MPKPIVFQLSETDSARLRSLLALPAPTRARRDLRRWWIAAAILLAGIAGSAPFWHAT